MALRRLISLFSCIALLLAACARAEGTVSDSPPSAETETAGFPTSAPATAEDTPELEPSLTPTVPFTPTRTPTPAPTWFPTLDAYFLKNVPDKGIWVAATIFDETYQAEATLTGVYGGIRDGGTAYGKLEYFYPHTGAIMVWRAGVTRCTSAVNAYPTGIERISLFDVKAVEFTTETGTCGGRNLVKVMPNGERITRAIVSRTEADGHAWYYGDVTSNDDLIIYIAYGPVAIPLSSVRGIALLPAEEE
jgi:hypothetical protein